MGELSDRRKQTEARLADLRAGLKKAEQISSGKACVYATGSFGRCEASSHSDLDLFILGKNSEQGADRNERHSLLTNLDEILVKAELINVTRALKIQEFSGDGRWLIHYAVHQLTGTLGRPEDDVTNTFTARLLLLLESRPLVGSAIYQEVVGDVIAEYWRDYPDHQAHFVPAFLANDILRLWRTFCVNYEAGTERQPDEKKAKGKLKNYKLKHSRLLTCYSALLYLLAVYRLSDTVRPEDAQAMIALSPTKRLEWLRDKPELNDATPTIEKLLSTYESFLVTTNAPEGELVKRFMDPTASQAYMKDAYDFGDFVFDALNSIAGKGNRFLRLLVV
jgi:hypothetical protein